MTCKCFTCQNKNNPEALYGYYSSEVLFTTAVVNELKELGVEPDSISNKTLGALLSSLEYNLMASTGLMSEVKQKLNPTTLEELSKALKEEITHSYDGDYIYIDVNDDIWVEYKRNKKLYVKGKYWGKFEPKNIFSIVTNLKFNTEIKNEKN